MRRKYANSFSNISRLMESLPADAQQQNSPPASQPSARRSISPDASSLFDNSTINTSQLTNITEPDANAPIAIAAAINTAAPAPPPPISVTPSAMLNLPPPRPRRVPTREEFRQVCFFFFFRPDLVLCNADPGLTACFFLPPLAESRDPQASPVPSHLQGQDQPDRRAPRQAPDPARAGHDATPQHAAAIDECAYCPAGHAGAVLVPIVAVFAGAGQGW